MREIRIKTSDQILDNQEMEWWNSNAEIIEKIWALNLDLQKIIRLPYLKKMKHFFTKDATNFPVKILEIGCGSGWVCRLVADKNFHVLGTDFSEGQLAIARAQAKYFNKDKFCTYELADASSFSKNIDGVVIHALLHHLSKEELDIFFEQLSKIPPETKVFMYEPVFLKSRGTKSSLLDKVLNRVITTVKKYATNRARVKGASDKELELAMEKIYADAKNNGWYISPKEVPFYEDELLGYLEPYFLIKKSYIVNKSDLDISQALVLNKIDKPDFLFGKVLIPLSTWLDKLAFKGNFTHYTPPLTHQFVCFEIVRKS